MLAKDKLIVIIVLVFKDLIDSYISHSEFVSLNNMFKEHKYIKEAVKVPKKDKKWHSSNVKWTFILSNTKNLQKQNNVKIKCEIDGNTNLYPSCIGCGFKKG